MSQVELLGLYIDNLSMQQTLDRIGDRLAGRAFGFAVTPNVDHVIKLKSDEHFRKIYSHAQLVVTDGVPLLWASRLLGSPIKERINGTDLFEQACEMAAQRGYSVYLLGGDTGAAEQACKVLCQRHADLKIAGWDCPPVGFEKDMEANQRVQARIQSSKADLLFVGLGAPKQERWMFDHAAATGVSFAIGVGVSFSFVAGQIRRAPKWMQRSGLEWMWRLIKEPRRLWKRYLQDSFFLVLVLKALLRQRTRQA